MNKEKFLSLSKEEIAKGISLSNQSASDHLRAAQLLAADGIYSIATSHLVLAGEEAAKATVLHIRLLELTKGIQLQIFDYDEIAKIFSQHKTKHFFAKENQKKLLVLLEAIIKKAKSVIESNEIEDKEEGLKNLDNVFNFISDESNMEWWNHANNNKNRGFYVGYQNGWQIPSEIGEEEYSKGYKVVAQLVILGRLLESLKVTNGT
jgi:AbiV family abortive infection protein